MTSHKPDPSELDLTDVEWTISSHSGGSGNCVRVGAKNGYLLIGDSQNPDRPPHIFTPAEAKAFLHGVREGDFDFLLDLR